MRFLGDDLWRAIHAVRGDPGKKWIAVPYVARGAADRFPLRNGDVLVVRFDDLTIQSGGTDPREIIRYLKHGVNVYNREDLHAKVYVSNRRAVVGSANLSRRSAERLKEAGVASSERKFIQQARKFVSSLRGRPITLEWARSKRALYVPQKSTGNHATLKAGPTMWAISFEVGDRSEEAEEAAAVAVKRAKSRLRRPDRFHLLDLQTWKEIPVKEGDWVFQLVHEGRERYFEAPARVLHINRFKTGHGESQIVVVQERKRLRGRSPAALIAKLKKMGLSLRRPRRFYRLTNAKLIDALYREWPE